MTIECPQLSEKGTAEVEAVIDSVRTKIKRVLDDAVGSLYVDISSYIESDAWQNYRNELRAELSRDLLKDGREENRWGFYVRQQIFKEHREELVELLNKDLLQEIENLKRQLEYARDRY